MKFRVFISSVQSEFAEERIRLVEYIRKDALLGLFFEPFIFEEVHACDSAQALNWAGYVEKSGNGTEAIVRRCVQSGLKTPEYHPDNTDFKVIIWRRAQSGHSQGTVRAQSGHSQGKPMSPQKRCLELLVGRELRRKEIAAALGFPNQSGYLNRLLRELVSDCLIERTIPDRPNSSQQRYRLTEKAIKVLEVTDVHN